MFIYPLVHVYLSVGSYPFRQLKLNEANHVPAFERYEAYMETHKLFCEAVMEEHSTVEDAITKNHLATVGDRYIL
jgi:hypothetical protein